MRYTGLAGLAEIHGHHDLAAKLAATQFVLAERETELLKLKGPCSNKDCPLHYAHNGPCDTTKDAK